MATTIPVEVDERLLASLRELHPGTSDREPIERLATTEVGMAALRFGQRDDVLDVDRDEVEVHLAGELGLELLDLEVDDHEPVQQVVEEQQVDEDT